MRPSLTLSPPTPRAGGSCTSPRAWRSGSSYSPSSPSAATCERQARNGGAGFGLPFIVIGSTLYTMLPGMEFAPLAAAESGSDAEAIQTSLVPWFVPTLVIGGILFLVGTFGFVVGIRHSGVLSPGLTSLVIGGLLTMAVSRLIPLTPGPVLRAGSGRARRPVAARLPDVAAAAAATQPRPLPTT